MKKQELKPRTQYHFSGADWEFICELTKIGSVHTLSSQVTLTSENEYLQFNDIMGGCQGLSLPENWVLEYATVKDAKARLTFSLNKPKD